MDILIALALVFMVWMIVDCLRRKERFYWIIIMVFLFPVGAVAYWFIVKNAKPNIDVSAMERREHRKVIYRSKHKTRK